MMIMLVFTIIFVIWEKKWKHKMNYEINLNLKTNRSDKHKFYVEVKLEIFLFTEIVLFIQPWVECLILVFLKRHPLVKKSTWFLIIKKKIKKEKNMEKTILSWEVFMDKLTYVPLLSPIICLTCLLAQALIFVVILPCDYLSTD